MKLIPVEEPDIDGEYDRDETEGQMAERIAAELNYYGVDEDLEEEVNKWIKDGKKLEIDNLTDLFNLKNKLTLLIKYWKQYGKAAFTEDRLLKNRDELNENERWEIAEAEFELQCVYDDVCDYICGVAAEFERNDSSK